MGNSDEGLGCWVVRLGILVLSVVRPPYTPSACRSALMPPIIHRAVLRRSRCAPLITCCTVGRDRRNARAIPGSTIAVLLCDPEVAPRRDALPSHLGRVADLSGMWIDRVHDHDPPRRVVLDMANSVSPTFGEQEGTGLVFCPPIKRREVIAGLVISFSMWQCAGHGEAVGPGFVH